MTSKIFDYVFFQCLYHSYLLYCVNLLIRCLTLTEKTISTWLFTNIWEIDQVKHSSVTFLLSHNY